MANNKYIYSLPSTDCLSDSDIIVLEKNDNGTYRTYGTPVSALAEYAVENMTGTLTTTITDLTETGYISYEGEKKVITTLPYAGDVFLKGYIYDSVIPFSYWERLNVYCWYTSPYTGYRGGAEFFFDKMEKIKFGNDTAVYIETTLSGLQKNDYIELQIVSRKTGWRGETNYIDPQKWKAGDIDNMVFQLQKDRLILNFN